MKLRSKEYCPIHRPLYCCGRELIPKKQRAKQLGVQRIEDTPFPPCLTLAHTLLKKSSE